MMIQTRTVADRPHVVVVGGGFGGLAAALALKRAPVQVTLLDRNNHHAFQPLLYQVATAGLEISDVGFPLRTVLRRHSNVDVLMAEAESIDAASRTVSLADGNTLAYDYLIVATGAQADYFGHAEWCAHAPSLKDLADAMAIRSRVLTAFERAEEEHDPEVQRAYLTFVIVGGGATGVELAGAIAELAKHSLRGGPSWSAIPRFCRRGHSTSSRALGSKCAFRAPWRTSTRTGWWSGASASRPAPCSGPLACPGHRSCARSEYRSTVTGRCR
jgi:NADH dehydrogenase FAD-containing subunit